MRIVRNRYWRALQLLIYGIRHPQVGKGMLGDLYRGLAQAEGDIVPVPFEEFFSGYDKHPLSLFDYVPRDGNLGLSEIVFICNCIATWSPKVVLEVGTFDGNTALQMAANAPPDAVVYTLDLPDDVSGGTVAKIDPGDVKYIDQKAVMRRRYFDTPYANKIVQKFGNSLELDFREILQGNKAELIFVDAGHSYDCVKNDSEKAMTVLSPGGSVIWDDYSAHWPGVYNYLNALNKELPLRRVSGTRLVVYRSPPPTA